MEIQNEKSCFKQGQREPEALKKARPGLPAFWEVGRHTSGSAAALLEASRALTLAMLKY